MRKGAAGKRRRPRKGRCSLFSLPSGHPRAMMTSSAGALEIPPQPASPVLPQGEIEMAKIESPYCPECHEAFDYPAPPPVDRRGFLRATAVGAAAAALAGTAR